MIFFWVFLSVLGGPNVVMLCSVFSLLILGVGSVIIGDRKFEILEDFEFDFVEWVFRFWNFGLWVCEDESPIWWDERTRKKKWKKRRETRE